MPWVYLLQAILMFALPLLSKFRLGATINILILGGTMYLLQSPIQLHFLKVAEEKYPQSVAFSSSLNGIFFNLRILLGSLVGGMEVDYIGLRLIGFGGGILAVVALILVLLLLKRYMKKTILKTK